MKKTAQSKARGFTLLEVLASSAIFLFAFVGLGLMSVKAAHHGYDANNQQQASKLAIQLLEQNVMRGYATLLANTGVTTGSITGPSGKPFNYTITVTDTSGPIGGGTPNLAVPSVMIEARVRWNASKLVWNADAGTMLNSQEISHATYVSAP